MPRIRGTVSRSVPITTVVNRSLTLTGTFDLYVSGDELARLGPLIDQLLASGILTGFLKEQESDGLVQASQIKSKYVLATTVATIVHMNANKQGLDTISALAGGSSQAQADARANLIKAAFIAHMADVGTSAVDGANLAADSTNSPTLAAIAASSSLGTCITLINGIRVAIIAHGNQAGRHFHNDTGTGGTGFTMTTTPPTTLAECVTDLNDILTGLLTHMGAAQASF